MTLANTLHKIRPAALITAGLLSAMAHAPAWSDGNLARARNCAACHSADKKLIGPAYKDIASRYAADKGAVAKLARKVRDGGTGVWGQVPMPANPQVSADEATTLVKWILSQK